MQAKKKPCSPAHDAPTDNRQDLTDLPFFAEAIYLLQHFDNLSADERDGIHYALQYLQVCQGDLLDVCADGFMYRHEHGIQDTEAAARVMELLAGISRYISNTHEQL